MSVAWYLAHWIVEESDVHNGGQLRQSLQILPLTDPIIVQVQELESMHARKRGFIRQNLQLVIAQINLLQLAECAEQLEIFNLVMLQVEYAEVWAVREALQTVF